MNLMRNNARDGKMFQSTRQGVMFRVYARKICLPSECEGVRAVVVCAGNSRGIEWQSPTTVLFATLGRLTTCHANEVRQDGDTIASRSEVHSRQFERPNMFIPRELRALAERAGSPKRVPSVIALLF